MLLCQNNATSAPNEATVSRSNMVSNRALWESRARVRSDSLREEQPDRRVQFEVVMAVCGHGIDIIELEEFRILLTLPNSDYLQRCFTARELETVADDHRRVERLAARFAAKEAVLKSLGTGWITGISWKDIEVSNASNGAPSVDVRGEVERLAKEKGVSGFLISITHTTNLAMASVIAVSD